MLNTEQFIALFIFFPSCLRIFCPFSVCCQVVLCCSSLTASVLVLHMVKKCSWQCSITSAKEKDVKPHWIQPWSCSYGDCPGQGPYWVQLIRDAVQLGKPDERGWGGANFWLCVECHALPLGILNVEVKCCCWKLSGKWGTPEGAKQVTRVGKRALFPGCCVAGGGWLLAT